MKKTKLLTPILATAALGSTVAPLVMLSSCNKSGEEIELDSSTAKEQTTSDNKTITTYAFNLRNKLNWQTNDEETTDEIDAEVEDVETTDDVTVEISALQYDPTTGKFYVTITTSKEDGTLNDGETVTFSLNLHCHKKGSKTDRWSRKFTKFVIKHSASQLWSGHFNDTDVTKVIKKDKTTEKGAELKEKITFPINPTEVWKESEASTDEYDLTKLNCYVLQDLDKKHFIDTIQLPNYSEKMKLELSTEDEQQYLTVTIPYTINQLAHFGSKARFALLFTYDGNTVFQSIGGFSINYVESAEEPHIILANSREQHYYNAQETAKEIGANTISFLLDTETSYVSEDFDVKSSNDRIKLGTPVVLRYEGPSGTIQLLTVPYAIVNKQTNPEPRPESSNIYNVELTVESTNISSEWTESVKGLSFYKGTGRFEEGTLVSVDETKLASVAYKANSEIDFTDVLKTCKPFDLKQFTYIYSYAMLDDETPLPFTIESLGWTYESVEHISVAKLDATGVTAGKHTLEVYVYIISAQASYAYCLNAGEVTFSE